MSFTTAELENIANSSLELYLRKPEVVANNITNKPLLTLLNSNAGSFSGGGGGGNIVSVGVKAGQGGLTIQGYSGNDQVGFGNPVGTKRASFVWKEHHLGLEVTYTELKIDGLEVNDNAKTTSRIPGRETHVIANLMQEKLAAFDEDYNDGMDQLLHADGTATPKAMSGIASLITESPEKGVTGGIDRALTPWWRNRAATKAFAADGGRGPVKSDPAGGGALIKFLDKEMRELRKYGGGADKLHLLCGSAFIDAYKSELRANGVTIANLAYTDGVPDGSMKDPSHGGRRLVYDPTMDAMGYEKRAYCLNLGRNGIRLLYLGGKSKVRYSPQRPHDRYVIYRAVGNTAVLVTRSLNTSAVYDIA